MNANKFKCHIPEEEITPTVATLLEFIQQQSEEIQALKDEIAKLKGQKPKPKIKPSNLDKNTNPPSQKRNSNSTQKKKSKSKTIAVHEEKNLHPENLPPGSKFIDYKNYLVQDIILANWNIMYGRGRWQTPSGKYITAELPQNVTGHFGADLQAFVLYQHYGCHVTQPLILEQLREIGVDISKGKINNILIHGKDKFHDEKEQILSIALRGIGISLKPIFKKILMQNSVTEFVLSVQIKFMVKKIGIYGGNKRKKKKNNLNHSSALN